MTKQAKQKVIDFLQMLVDNRLVTRRNVDGEVVYKPCAGVTLEYKDRKVLEISEYGEYNVFESAMVIALDGREHFLEENITPATFKHFEAFKKFKLS